MQAVILAGGKGTRLRPYTVNFPKPLVPIGDYPVMEVVIRQLATQGFKQIIISTGHLAGLIEAYFGDGKKWGVEIVYVCEEKPLSTAGGLKLISGLEENFLVMNGDLLTTLDYRNFLAEHSRRGLRATIATKARESKIDFGVVEFDGNGFLTGYREKPVYHFPVSMGIYAIQRLCIDLIQDDEALGMPDLLLRIVRSGSEVHCVTSDAYWLDIGRVDDYEMAQEAFQANRHRFLPNHE